MPPETIAGRYRIEREVGRGGMGSVWLCHDELLGRTVAAKQVGLLPGETTPDLARAMREARSSAPLNHRNVVSVYDAIEEGDHIWLVMEYVAGRTLAQLIKEGPLEPGRAAGIGAQVADGLAAAHARGTVHRDVKPGNILVTDDDHAKISDFGISRTTGDAALTQSGLVSGTPAYFSPQLARGKEPTPADDVWALGATLYAAVEGRPPFPEQGNALAMLTAITSDEPRPARDAGALDGPLQRMLDSDPDARWSMTEVAQALHRIHRAYDDRGTRESAAVAAATTRMPASDPTPTPTPTPTPPPEPAYVAPAPAVPNETDPDRSGGSGRRGLVAVLAVLALLAVAGGGYLLLSGQNDDSPGTATSAGSSSTPKKSERATRKPSATSDPTTAAPTPETSSTPESSTTPEASTTPVTSSSSPAGFVRDYYGVLPDDTASGWRLLSPAYRSRTSYGSYSGFWSGIAAVAVNSATSAGANAVNVSLTYTRNDGSTATETRTIQVEQSGDSYLITGD